jgi:hypothetical protein
MRPDALRRLAWGGVVFALLLFWLIGLRHLADVPRAYEDEAWIASTGYKLATAGVFGTDIQGGFFGMHTHYFGFMPLFPLIESVVFRLAGVSLWSSRLTSLSLGTLTLALTFELGRRLYGAPIGLLAVAGLLLASTAGLTVYRPTGILMLDLARMARYDIAVPVFGLAAALALGRAPFSGGRRALAWAALAGALGGLAGLAHVYGWFWLAALGAAVVYLGGQRRARRWVALMAGGLALGAALTIGPYLVYVIMAWSNFVGQMGEYGDRMELGNLSWYAANLINEFHRYGPGLGQSGWLRPGLWLVVALAPVGLLLTLRRARTTLLAATAAAALVLLPALLALLITSKVANYLLLYLPVAAVALAGAAARLWQVAQRRGWRWLRVGLLLAGVWAAAEGVGQWQRLDVVAAANTPFVTYLSRVRAVVDEAAAPLRVPVVLGLHTYWYGFVDLPFSTWYYPLAQARTPVPGGAVPVTVTLNDLAPDVVLVDARMRLMLTAEGAEQGAVAEINTWLADNYTVAGAVDDATYGRMEVYLRAAGAAP